MKRFLLLACFFATSAFGMARYSNWCEQGNIKPITGGVSSSTIVQGSYPRCVVTVTITGGGIATIYSDNASTPLANPFTASANGTFFFYAANGSYDVTLSGGGPPSISVPFTIGAVPLFDFSSYTPNNVFAYPSSGVPGIVGIYNSNTTFYAGFTALPNLGANAVWTLPGSSATGCLSDNGGFVLSINTGCLPGGPPDSIQTNAFGSFGGSANFTFDPTLQSQTITGLPGTPGLSILGGASTISSGGFISTAHAITSFTGSSDGAKLAGITANQNSPPTIGGYIHLTPVTYNPYDQPGVCKDSLGNIVTQPLPLPGDSFGPDDVVLWVGPSPQLPASPTANCPTPGGPPLPTASVNGGLNTNQYLFARGGFATDNAQYNSIQSFNGGFVAAQGYIAGPGYAFYPFPSTVCTTLGTPGSVAGVQYGGWGYAGGSNYCYYDNVMATWRTINLASGGGGGTVPGLPADSVQFNSNPGGTFLGSANFEWNNSTKALSIIGTANNAVALDVTTGFIQVAGGLSATTCGGTFNCIQTVNGGISSALGFTTPAQIALGPNGSAPTPPGGMNEGGIAAKGTGLHYWFLNQSTATYVDVDLAASGGGCTVSGTAGNVLYVDMGGSTCANNGNFTWNNSTQQAGIQGTGASDIALSVHAGYTESEFGFLSDGVNSYNSFQAVGTGGGCSGSSPCAGMYAKSFTAVGGYVQLPSLASDPSATGTDPTFGNGALYYSSVSNCVKANVSGSFTCLAAGGGGSPGGITTSIQFNNGGTPATFGGSSSFLWNDTSKLLTITGTAPTAMALNVGLGYALANGGFNTGTCALSNCFESAAGGVTTLKAIFGGPLGVTPATITLLGTSMAGGSQRSAINFDNAAGSTVLWEMGTDLAAAGGNDFFLFNPTSGTTMTFNSTGNAGIGGNASAVSGQRLNIYGSSSVSGIIVQNGFITSDGGFVTASTSVNAIQAPNGTVTSKNISATQAVFNSIQTAGGFQANDLGGTTPVLTTNGTTLIDGNRNALNFVNLTATATTTLNNLTVTGTCTGCSAGSASSYNATATSGNTFFNNNGNFSVTAAGVLTVASNSASALGAPNGFVTALGHIATAATTNSIQTVGGFRADSASGSTAVLTMGTGPTTLINGTGQFVGPNGISTSGNATVNTLTTTGLATLTAGATITGGAFPLFQVQGSSTFFDIAPNAGSTYINGSSFLPWASTNSITYNSGGNNGVTCSSGINAGTYRSVGGITTHC